MTPLERDRELAAIDAAGRAAADGRGGVVLLEGPAGIGKTIVLDEARRRLADDLRPLRARGSGLERDFGFGVVRQLLELAVAAREVPDAARTVLADPVADVAGPAGESSFAALHALFWTVIDLAAERPLLLAVDDLHWADRPSLRFLAYLARRLEELPVLLLATVRTGEPDVEEELLDALRQPPASVLEPGPLTPAGVEALVAERLGPAEPGFASAVHETTGGNPLFVRELTSALEAEGVAPQAASAAAVRAVGPRAVSRTVGARLARLDADAVATAQAVAVLGDGVSVTTAAAFAGLDEARVARATGPLARAEVLRADPPLGFVHPLVAEAVRQTLPPGERELQHARAAALLHEAGAPTEHVAGHLLRAPAAARGWAVEALRDAARTALRRGAPESAAAFLRRALDEPPAAADRVAILLELGLAGALSSGPGAVEHLRGALASLVDPGQRVLAASALGRTLLFTGRPRAANEVALAVADELGPERADERDQLRAFALVTGWFDEVGAVTHDATRALRDRVPGPGAGAGARMLAAMAAFDWAAAAGPRDACVALALGALAEDRVIAVDNGLMNIPAVAVLIAAEAPEAITSLEHALAEAHRVGSLYALVGDRMWLAHARTGRSELEEAEGLARQTIADLLGWGAEQPDFATAFLVEVLVARGDLTGARAALAVPRRPEVASEGARRWHEAELALLVAERRDPEAREVAERLATTFGHVRNPALAAWRSTRAVLRHRTGDLDGARADLDEDLELAEAWGAPGPIARALRLRGELLGDDAALHRAVAVAATSVRRTEHALALLALGRRVRLDRRPTEARAPLGEALDVAVACGAEGLVEEVRRELAAAGVRPRTEALSGPASLTPSEQRVAEMAARGLTNRDIAQQLFVTPKTVEVHLSAVYRKLGIASRRALESALVA